MSGRAWSPAASWNREAMRLDSDEVLAQLLDRGTLDDWRRLYALAKEDAGLRARIAAVVARVPLYLPRFWLAALQSLGEPVSLDAVAPNDGMQE